MAPASGLRTTTKTSSTNSKFATDPGAGTEPRRSSSMRNRATLALSLLVVVIAVANLFPSHAQKVADRAQPEAGNGAPPLSNPLKVALLKWYRFNDTTRIK